MIALPDAFWLKVEITQDHWLWTACLNSKGYGCFAVSGRSRLVHRLAYEALRGPIPEGMTIDHFKAPECPVTCIKPAHLEVVTRAENTRRARARVTHCKQGHELTKAPDGRCRRCLTCENAARKAERLRASLSP